MHSLKFQIIAALLVILVLFGGATLFTFSAIQRHSLDNVILNLANKLQVTARQINRQAQNYQQNAPRDYETYYRDVRLYYRDLMGHMDLFDQITGAFMSGGFPPELTNLDETVYPLDNERLHDTVTMLEDTWVEYRSGLIERLGTEPLEPRLEYAAKFIFERQDELTAATDMMLSQVQDDVNTHLKTINFTNWILLLASGIVVIGVIIWFYLKVLRPLDQSVKGFQRVAEGDFGHQLPVSGHHEFAMMTRAFNRLSERLNAIFRLIDRLQQGSDVESTVAFVWDEFSAQLPMDWAGLLIGSGDEKHLKLAASHNARQPGPPAQGIFSNADPLLHEVFRSGEPTCIDELGQWEGKDSPIHQLLNEQGMASALLMPLITPNMQATGILLFASRQPRAYRDEHIALLCNIGQLVTHSFWKTVRMVESNRLAAIGEFASGVAHEIRNPLTTINMAIEYFLNSDLPANARKRAELAAGETQRVTRLLEDMLIYAKPLVLNLQRVDLRVQLDHFMRVHGELFEASRHRALITQPEQPAWLLIDPDRLMQILLNLSSNACNASPAGSEIRLVVQDRPDTGKLELLVQNAGPAIPADQLARMTEAFFTTRSRGIGLGLSIVQRLVTAHGGELSFTSTDQDGTTARIVFPAV